MYIVLIIINTKIKFSHVKDKVIEVRPTKDW